MQFGSLQFGQFLHLIFFLGILFDNISFCSSGFNLKNDSISINLLFCSSVDSAFSNNDCSFFVSLFISLLSWITFSLFVVIGFFFG